MPLNTELNSSSGNQQDSLCHPCIYVSVCSSCSITSSAFSVYREEYRQPSVQEFLFYKSFRPHPKWELGYQCGSALSSIVPNHIAERQGKIITMRWSDCLYSTCVALAVKMCDSCSAWVHSSCFTVVYPWNGTLIQILSFRGKFNCWGYFHRVFIFLPKEIFAKDMFSFCFFFKLLKKKKLSNWKRKNQER